MLELMSLSLLTNLYSTLHYIPSDGWSWVSLYILVCLSDGCGVVCIFLSISVTVGREHQVLSLHSLQGLHAIIMIKLCYLWMFYTSVKTSIVKRDEKHQDTGRGCK